MILSLFFINTLLWVCVSSGVLDQSQTGDLNVQLNVKDVRIFALLDGGNKEEYVDYDYAYDYSELTIKPQNRTTPKPFNCTSQSTEQIQNSTALPNLISQNNSTETPITSEDTISMNGTDTYATTIKPTFENTNQTFSEATQPVTPSSSQPSTIKSCKKGFVLNHMGNCQLRQNTAGNALTKLVKLSQRLKLRRGNRKTNDS